MDDLGQEPAAGLEHARTKSASHPVALLEDSSAQQLASVCHNRDYLTLSQLSPRKPNDSRTISTTPDSSSASEADTASQLPSQSITPSERPSSPMRRSIKRAGSPVGPAHGLKRSKTATEPSEPSSHKELNHRKPALQPSRTRNAPAATATSATSVKPRRVVSVTSAGARANRAQNADIPRKAGASSARPRTRALSTSVPGGEAATAAARSKAPRPEGSSQNGHGIASTSSSGRSGQQLTSSQKENVSAMEGCLTEEQKSGRPTSSAADRPVRSHFSVSSHGLLFPHHRFVPNNFAGHHFSPV